MNSKPEVSSEVQNCKLTDYFSYAFFFIIDPFFCCCLLIFEQARNVSCVSLIGFELTELFCFFVFILFVVFLWCCVLFCSLSWVTFDCWKWISCSVLFCGLFSFLLVLSLLFFLLISTKENFRNFYSRIFSFCCLNEWKGNRFFAAEKPANHLKRVLSLIV